MTSPQSSRAQSRDPHFAALARDASCSRSRACSPARRARVRHPRATRLTAAGNAPSSALAWKVGDSTRWRFSFDPKAGKPYFHPVAVANGPSLTNFKPEDHPWHYALWFSWKYVNRVNYWEENRVSGQAAGATRWSAPTIDARPDGSARITMRLTYARPTGEVDLTEARVLDVSAPASDGSYTIDWSMRFTAGKDGAVLDRTPMPGEPNGVINGGYAGLSARLAASPATMTVMTHRGAADRVPRRARAAERRGGRRQLLARGPRHRRFRHPQRSGEHQGAGALVHHRQQARLPVHLRGDPRAGRAHHSGQRRAGAPLSRRDQADGVDAGGAALRR